MNKTVEQLETTIGKKVFHNESLASHTLLKANTTAEFYLEIEKIEDLIKAVQTAWNLKIPVFVFGSGSRVELPEEETILGLIIKNNCRRFDKMSMRGTIHSQEVGVSEVLVQAESGTLMNQLVRFTIEEGLEGLEYQLGMPGTVGGAIYTDAAYKKNNVRDCLQAVRIVTKEGNVEMHTQDLEKYFSEAILLSAIFRLVPADKALLWRRGQEAAEERNKA